MVKKADIVPLDFRNLTAENQKVLLDAISGSFLTTTQKSQIIIVR